jgi:hypothetical protein
MSASSSAMFSAPEAGGVTSSLQREVAMPDEDRMGRRKAAIAQRYRDFTVRR